MKANVFLAQIQGIIGGSTTPTEEWWTTYEMQKKCGVKESRTREIIRRLRKAGKLETKWFIVPDETGSLIRRPYHKWLDKKLAKEWAAE